MINSLSSYVDNHDDFSEFFSSEIVVNDLLTLIKNYIDSKDDFFIVNLKILSKINFSLYKLIYRSEYWLEIFLTIKGDYSLVRFLDGEFPIELLPLEFISTDEEAFFKYMSGLDKNIRDLYFSESINSLPIHLVIASIVSGDLSDNDLIDCRFNEIKIILENRFKSTEDLFPDYLDDIFNKEFKSTKDYLLNPTLGRILEPVFLKRRVFNKSNDIKQYYDQCMTLTGDAELFILANLFSLLQVENTLDNTYKIFLHRLWESLVTEEISIHDKGVLILFPSCSKLGFSGLSCEAFFWPKTETYLCRGSVCKNPKVKIEPGNKKHYLDYNIYDWFNHYEVDYVNDGEPSKKDFPIKLAGYFNRLKEIFDVLKCRECEKLMKPDMKYARTEYIDYESGVPVKKSISAAYRATVFGCGNEACSEYEVKYYISHCLGFGCGSVIDTRDLSQKCDSGLYICKSCGSCCEQHAKENPVGLCADCGCKLNLFEYQKIRDKFGKYKRIVKCSNVSCGFKIDKFIPKKFTLPSCTPVIKI